MNKIECDVRRSPTRLIPQIRPLIQTINNLHKFEMSQSRYFHYLKEHIGNSEYRNYYFEE